MADFPSGIILLWHGAIVDIPVGWAWCDGNNGTPNLKNRFIVCAGGVYPVDGTGGDINHTHPFSATTHKHLISAGAAIAAGANFKNETDLTVATGTTNATSSLPPYHALAYIMKL